MSDLTSDSGSAVLTPDDLPALKTMLEEAYGPLDQIASYARANPLARLRLLRAIHDTAAFTCQLAVVLIADSLLHEEATAAAQALSKLPWLPEAQA